METSESQLYSIVWHFEGTTLTSHYASEEKRDAAFDEIVNNLAEGIMFHKMGDMVLNARDVLCITKGGADEWNCLRAD